MARICSQCKFYTDNGETVCPTCKVDMQLTFLPPPGQSAAPVPHIDMGPEPAPRRRRPQESAASQLFDLFRFITGHRKVASSVFGVILILGGVMFGWGTAAIEDRFDRIEIGMDEQEVRDILSPPHRGRKWRTPEWVNRPCLSTEGYASFHHTEGGATITVEFMDGLVTRKSIDTKQTASR